MACVDYSAGAPPPQSSSSALLALAWGRGPWYWTTTTPSLDRSTATCSTGAVTPGAVCLVSLPEAPVYMYPNIWPQHKVSLIN